MEELIEWIDADKQLPDDELTVMVFHPSLNEPVWFGYYDVGIWYTPNGEPLLDVVTHWAEMPGGPTKPA